MNEFSEDFAKYPITSTIDYLSDYYQIPLDKSYRDLTTFMSLLGLVRMTRLLQGWTNSMWRNLCVLLAKFIIVKSLTKYNLFSMSLTSKNPKIDIITTKFLRIFGDSFSSMHKSFANYARLLNCWSNNFWERDRRSEYQALRL